MAASPECRGRWTPSPHAVSAWHGCSVTSRFRRAVWILAAVAGLVLAGVLVWPVTDWLAARDVGRIAGPQSAGQLATAREAVRSQMLTLAAGLFAVGALVFTALNFILSREGQVTDRYTKAIEQLGSGNLDVRIGGIYALERIAHDSARDHPTVVEVLAAFVREHSRDEWPPEAIRDADGVVRRARPDVQTALTVLGRRNSAHDRLRLDLEAADLSYANLSKANLARAWLTKVNLNAANLGDADLSGASLFFADLTFAMLSKAKLTNAHLDGAKLDAGLLKAADLTRAGLFLASYPPDAELPKGWTRDSEGKLRRADRDP
jgi:hypothetical protein